MNEKKRLIKIVFISEIMLQIKCWFNLLMVTFVSNLKKCWGNSCQHESMKITISIIEGVKSILRCFDYEQRVWRICINNKHLFALNVSSLTNPLWNLSMSSKRIVKVIVSIQFFCDRIKILEMHAAFIAVNNYIHFIQFWLWDYILFSFNSEHMRLYSVSYFTFFWWVFSVDSARLILSIKYSSF